MDSMSGLRLQRAIKAKPGDVVEFSLPPIRAPTSYYTKIIISDVVVKNLKLFAKDDIILSNDREIFFHDLKLREGVVSFEVVSVSLFGKAVINIHKHSDTVWDFYL